MEVDEEKLKLRLRDIVIHLQAQVPVSTTDFYNLLQEVIDEIGAGEQIKASIPRLTLVK